jgi:hypothetical protein
MTELYDTSRLDNVTNVYQLAKELNTISDGLLMGGFLVTVGIVLVVVFYNKAPFKDLLLAVSFMVTFLAVLLWAAQLLTVGVIAGPLIMLLIAVFVKIWG